MIRNVDFSSICNERVKMVERKKELFQRWLNCLLFSHKIDIEPSPSKPYKSDEIIQRFRQITFELNKKYLKSTFPKWKPEDKFWVIGFVEGDNLINERHYHFLLHSPKTIYKNCIGNSPIWDLLTYWIQMKSFSLITRKPRKMISNRKDKFHIGSESLIEKLPLQIAKINNVIGSTNYASKWMNRFENDNYFIVGIQE